MKSGTSISQNINSALDIHKTHLLTWDFLESSIYIYSEWQGGVWCAGHGESQGIVLHTL